MEKASMVCEGFKLKTAGWWLQTNPLSFGGHKVADIRTKNT